MHGLKRKFRRRQEKLKRRVKHVFDNKDSYESWEFRWLTETLISDLWQSWNVFCRDLIVYSAKGCVALNGVQIDPRYTEHQHGHTVRRIEYEATCYAKKNSLKEYGHDSFQYYQSHTWGDVSKMQSVIQGLGLSNNNCLSSAFGSMTYIVDLQGARNACSHKNASIIKDLRGKFISKYNISGIMHPTQYVWSNLVGSHDLAINVWLREIDIAASNAMASK